MHLSRVRQLTGLVSESLSSILYRTLSSIQHVSPLSSLVDHRSLVDYRWLHGGLIDHRWLLDYRRLVDNRSWSGSRVQARRSLEDMIAVVVASLWNVAW